MQIRVCVLSWKEINLSHLNSKLGAGGQIERAMQRRETEKEKEWKREKKAGERTENLQKKIEENICTTDSHL